MTQHQQLPLYMASPSWLGPTGRWCAASQMQPTPTVLRPPAPKHSWEEAWLEDRRLAPSPSWLELCLALHAGGHGFLDHILRPLLHAQAALGVRIRGLVLQAQGAHLLLTELVPGNSQYVVEGCVNPRELYPVPHAGHQLPAGRIRQRHMPRGAPPEATALADAALQAIGQRALPLFFALSHHGEHLQVVECGRLALGVHRVENGAVHGVEHGPALVATELPDDLQLLRHLLTLKLRGDELQTELAVALAHLHEGVWAELLLGPLGEEGLQAEIGAHDGVAATKRQAHEPHRWARCRRTR